MTSFNRALWVCVTLAGILAFVGAVVADPPCDSEAQSVVALDSPGVVDEPCGVNLVCHCNKLKYDWYCVPSDEWHCIVGEAVVAIHTGEKCSKILGICLSCDDVFVGQGKANLICESGGGG